MVVVSDRYADSTFAYQPVALEPHLDHPRNFMAKVMEPWNLEPDLTIYLEVSVDTAIERSVGDEEYENREFLRNVKSNYDELRETFSDRYVTVDAEQPIEDVQAEVLELVRAHR